MSVTDSTSVIQLKKVGSLLPALSVDFEQLLEHLKELKKEDPEKYAEMNALFNSCRAAEEEDEEEEPDCGVCYEKTRSDGRGRDANIGCCDGCHIRVMCKDCGVWDEDDEVWRCPDCQEEHENEIWEDDALVLELNHGNCENDGRHPKTNDEDWALFLESFIRPLSYSEEKYRRLEKRLQERAHHIMVRNDPLPCETCKKPVWSNNDVFQKVHGCIVCQDCFDEHEKEHALEKKINLTVGA